MRYSLLLGLVLLLTLASGVFAQTAECPSWQVGDEWAWGGSYDLKEVVVPFLQELVRSGEVGSWKCDGKLESYEVVKIDAIEEECYLASVKGGSALEFELSLNPQAAGESPLEVSAQGVIKANGTGSITVRQLAFKTAAIAITGDFSFTVKTTGLKMSFSVRDFRVDLSVLADEPLDFFNFPIEVGENWTFRSRLRESFSLCGRVEGNISMFGYENSFSEEIREENFVDVIVEGFCTCPRMVEMKVDEIPDNCFEIKIHSRFTEPEGFVLPIVFTLYYSPSKRQVIASSFDLVDILSAFETSIKTVGREISPELGGSFEELGRALQSISEVEGTLSITSLSPQEALRRIEGIGKKSEIPWILLGIPAVIIACILLVRKFY
jgi:hypothetical protein